MPRAECVCTCAGAGRGLEKAPGRGATAPPTGQPGSADRLAEPVEVHHKGGKHSPCKGTEAMGKQGHSEKRERHRKAPFAPANGHNTYYGVCDVHLWPWKQTMTFLEKGMMRETYSELLLLQKTNSM